MPDLKVKVGLIGKFDMLKFKNMKKVRVPEILLLQRMPVEWSGIRILMFLSQSLSMVVLTTVLSRRMSPPCLMETVAMLMQVVCLEESTMQETVALPIALISVRSKQRIRVKRVLLMQAVWQDL